MNRTIEIMEHQASSLNQDRLITRKKIILNFITKIKVTFLMEDFISINVMTFSKSCWRYSAGFSHYSQ